MRKKYEDMKKELLGQQMNVILAKSAREMINEIEGGCDISKLKKLSRTAIDTNNLSSVTDVLLSQNTIRTSSVSEIHDILSGKPKVEKCKCCGALPSAFK